MQTSADPSWTFYPQTLLRFAGQGLTIDLRNTICPETLKGLSGLGLGLTFVVITAHNPRGRTLDAATNQTLDAELGTALNALGAAHQRCDGMDPEQRHVERGYAAAIDNKQATLLAKQFGQSAFFTFDGERFWLMPALVRTNPLQLPK
jgi:hypothetical protein